MSEAGRSRKLAAEVGWGSDRKAVVWVGAFPLHHYWPMLAPYFSDVLLPPQRRMEGDTVAWSWMAGEGDPSAEELAALRRRLAADMREFADRTEDGGNRSDQAAVVRAMQGIVHGWTEMSDAELARYAARTANGLRVHGWSATRAPRVFDPAAAAVGESASPAADSGGGNRGAPRRRSIRWLALLLLLIAIVGAWLYFRRRPAAAAPAAALAGATSAPDVTASVPPAEGNAAVTAAASPPHVVGASNELPTAHTPTASGAPQPGSTEIGAPKTSSSPVRGPGGSEEAASTPVTLPEMTLQAGPPPAPGAASPGGGGPGENNGPVAPGPGGAGGGIGSVGSGPGGAGSGNTTSPSGPGGAGSGTTSGSGPGGAGRGTNAGSGSGGAGSGSQAGAGSSNGTAATNDNAASNSRSGSPERSRGAASSSTQPKPSTPAKGTTSQSSSSPSAVEDNPTPPATNPSAAAEASEPSTPNADANARAEANAAAGANAMNSSLIEGPSGLSSPGAAAPLRHLVLHRTPWAPVLLADVILPTMPSPVSAGPAQSTAALRDEQRALAQKALPDAYRAINSRQALLVALPSGETLLAPWPGPALERRAPNGAILVKATFPSAEELDLSTAPGVRLSARFMIRLDSPPSYRWQTRFGDPLPPNWSASTTATESIITIPLENAGASQRPALFDPASGWALTSQLTLK